MINFKDQILTNIYNRVKNREFTDEEMFNIIRFYIKKPLKDNQKEFVRTTANKIKSGEMTVEEFIELFDMKVKLDGRPK